MNQKMSNAEYHAATAISKSGLDLIAKSPAHFQAGFSGIDLDVARVGTAFHAWVLEDSDNILTTPNFGTRSGKNKPLYEDWFKSNGATEGITQLAAAEWFPEFERQTGISLLSEKEHDELEKMVTSVLRNDQAKELLESGQAEQSIFAEYLDTECKCRPDFIVTGGNVLVDLKTTQDAGRRPFRNSCASYRYHVQDAFYSQIYYQATGIYPDFYFIAVEKSPPYSCVVYQLDAEAKENGHYLMDRDLQTFKECSVSGFWPSHDNDLSLDIPIYDRETFGIFIDGQEMVV